MKAKKLLEPKDLEFLQRSGESRAYCVEMSFGALLDWVELQKAVKGLNLAPDFHRGLVWTMPQKVAFMEFLLRGGQTHPLLFNHPGWRSTYLGDFIIVDGLQRLSAILSFANEEFSVFAGILSPCGVYASDFLESTLDRLVSVRIEINNLATRREVLAWYLDINTTGTPHSVQEIGSVRSLLAAKAS